MIIETSFSKKLIMKPDELRELAKRKYEDLPRKWKENRVFKIQPTIGDGIKIEKLPEMRKLEQLRVSYSLNLMKGELKGLKKLKNLRELYISSCNVGSLVNLPEKIEILHADHNPLRIVSLNNLKRLKDLRINCIQNQPEEFPETIEILSIRFLRKLKPLRNLRILTIQLDSFMEDINEFPISDFPKLQKVTIKSRVFNTVAELSRKHISRILDGTVNILDLFISRNTEFQRFLLERCKSKEEFLKPGKEIRQVDKTETAEMYELSIPEFPGKRIKVCFYKDFSTNRTYVAFVPPKIRKCEKFLSWKHYFSIKDWREAFHG